ncbi:MAG TPA: hypothetical protein VKB46_05325, partial [Pyrinomonadaceae bacterium]|nr:hypothetical protein [Pyrinomonadaceae bacterium]
MLIAVTLVHLSVRATTELINSGRIINSSSTSDGRQLTTPPIVEFSSLWAAPPVTTARPSIAITSNTLLANLNGKIAFSDGDLIRMVNADATGLLTFGNGLKPAWSADGTKLAFLSGSSFVTSHDVYVVNANGTGLLRIATNASGETAPTWSPDGEFVAYQGLDNAVYRADRAGTSVTKLFDNPDTLKGLRWSPTGQQFAIAKGGDIYVLSTNGSNQAKLTNHPSQSPDSNPRWSIDGQRVMFTRGLDAYVVGADGIGEARLLNFGYAKNATWSPDGQKVVFQLPASLGIMNVDGTLFSQILLNVAGPNISDPDWQPVPTGLPLPSPTPSPTVFTISGHIDPTANTSGTVLHLTGTRGGERGIDA